MNQLFKDPFLNITATTGGIFFAAGLFMLRFPPKKINFLYGYRTNASMRNQERWDFAQKYAAKEMMITGLVLAASGVLGFIIDFGGSVKIWVGVAMLGVAILILKLRVEKAY